MHKPSYSHMTLPLELYDAVCERIDQGFADSYLTGAELVGRRLTPRTHTAWRRMRDTAAFRDLLKEAKLELVEPDPFPGRDGRRLSHKEIYSVH
jgi:hypothetical protein